MTLSENPWEEVEQELLAAAIKYSSEETQKELAKNLRLLL